MVDQIAEDGAVIDVEPVPHQGPNINNYNLVGKIVSDKEYNFSSIRAGLMGIWGNPAGVMISDVDRNKVLISFRDHVKGRQILDKGPWTFRGQLLNLQRTSLPRVWVSFKYERIQDNYCLKCGIIGHNKRDCNKPAATASWNPLKPRYLPGLGLNRPPPIQEMEVLETQIQLDPWENEILRANQGQIKQGQANQNHAAAAASNTDRREENLTNTEGRDMNHFVQGTESKGEVSVPTVGVLPLNPPAGFDPQ
ncbi:hypothetical protein PIB30_083724 [Stylosanthes scabra]|uniref:CCHC-type domain-containing protein n=1 Tax=Stylosanthes scabra TaxID=79078 RepID=A0ABU6ZQZ1_9FABA|nr:hypothetical protein [Stylosanthes scabra]